MSDRILVVDDDQELAELVGMLLSKHGYETKVAFDGESALKEVCDFSPAVILQDFILPDIRGDELLVRLKERCPDSYIIAMTAKGSEEVAAELFRAGASDYLKKPIESDKLISTVENVLRLRSSESVRDELEGALMRHSQEFLLINAFSAAMNADIPRTEKYDIAADLVLKGMRADYVRISVIDPQTGKLGLLVSECTDTVKHHKDALDKELGLAEYVAEIIKPAAVRDFSREDRFTTGYAFRDAGLTSALSVPMTLGGKTVGVLGAYMKARTNFPSFVIKLLDSFANLIALDIENEQLTERADRLESIITGVCNSCGDRVTIQDLSHKILYANEAAAEAVGQTVKDIIGHQCCWIFHNSKEPMADCPVEEALKTGRQVVKVIAMDGVKMRVTAELIRNNNGDVEAVVEQVRPA